MTTIVARSWVAKHDMEAGDRLKAKLRNDPCCWRKARRHADEIRRAGAEAIKETLAEGVPVYYIDDRIGAGIIKEMPDGKRFRIEIAAGEEVVTESLAPGI
jgi:hypothetical protein